MLPSVASWFASIASWCNWVSFWFMDHLDSLPVAQLIWASPSLSWIAVYIGVLLSVFWCVGVIKEVDVILFPRLVRLARRFLLTSSVIGIIWLALGFGFLSREGTSTVSFLDVGQGDSSIIRTPNNRVILVDGGGTMNFMKAGEEWRIRQDPYEIGEDLVVPLLKKRGINQIDYLIMTHSDMDHIGGLKAVLEAIPVKRILFNGTFRSNAFTEELFAIAVERNVPLYPVWAGRELEVDQHTKLNFLYPSEVVEELDSIPLVEDQNRYSVVFTMTMYDSTFLFTGDMDAAAEREVLARLVELRAGDEVEEEDDESGGGEIDTIDVLKVAHHGSKTSTTESWLGLWQPKVGIISVGERNMYRHPSPLVIDRLARHEVLILRTDMHGEVQMRVGEEGVIWRTFSGK